MDKAVQIENTSAPMQQVEDIQLLVSQIKGLHRELFYLRSYLDLKENIQAENEQINNRLSRLEKDMDIMTKQFLHRTDEEENNTWFQRICCWIK